MAVYLILAVVGMALGALVVPMIITSSQTTRSDTSRVHALDAAQAGLNVMLGRIRSRGDRRGRHQHPAPVHRHLGAGQRHNAYQGFLPTYLYPFQFWVRGGERPEAPALFDLGPAIMLLSIAFTAIVLGYSAWSWRIALAERRRDRLARRRADAAGRWTAGAATRRSGDRQGDARATAGPRRGSPAGSLPCAARRRITKP